MNGWNERIAAGWVAPRSGAEGAGERACFAKPHGLSDHGHQHVSLTQERLADRLRTSS
jgi:hypothetical protein